MKMQYVMMDLRKCKQMTELDVFKKPWTKNVKKLSQKDF